MKALLSIEMHKAEEYRWEVFLSVIYLAGIVVMTVFFWWGIYTTGGRIPGWELRDVIMFAFLTGFVTYFNGVVYSALPGVRDIFTGRLAVYLTKPAILPLVVLPYRLDAEDFVATVLRLVIVVLAGLLLGYSPLHVLAGVLLAMVGACAEIFLYATIVFLSFYIGDSSGIRAVYDVVWGWGTQYPIDAFKHSHLFWIFTFVIPLYFLATLPMHAVMGWKDWMIFVLPAILGMWGFVAKLMWENGLKRWEAYGG